MKKYKLVTNDFILEMELDFFEEDVKLPINSILNIKINSDGFSSLTTMDIDIKDFKEFASKLLQVHKSLIGSAMLKETYGTNYIEFKAIKNGYIYVRGLMNNHSKSGYEQELKFENEFDQTYLECFVNEINK